MEMDRRVACAEAVMAYNNLRGARMASRKRQRRLQRVAALLYKQEVTSMLNCNRKNIFPQLRRYNYILYMH